MTSTAYCPSCGHSLSDSGSFCGHCGHQIRERDHQGLASRRSRLTGTSDVIAHCESCNAPLRAHDTFCPDCGARRTSAGERSTGLEQVAWQDLRDKLDHATTGEFEILRELGRGGMGAVYLALELALDRLVAIKVLLPNLLNQPGLVERFRNEARIVAALRHPGIVNIHTVRHLEDVHFFVMDYIQGASLQQVIREHGPLPVPVVRAILQQVGGALAYGHRQGRGVIHRDVKPSNIMLDHEGGAMVMDFGISKVLHVPSGLTKAGTVMGTPEYMSPEQCRGDALTPSSDQYALGLVGYAMLTGGPPFSGTKYAVFVAQLQKEPPLIRSLRPDCPQDLAEAVERMLAKTPDGRFPDIRSALTAVGGRAPEHGDPVRDEIAALVRAAAGSTHLPVPVAELLVTPPPAELYPGDRFVLDATPTDYLGRTILGRDLHWSSTDPAVLSVSSEGAAEALAEGRATVVVRCEGQEARVDIRVARPMVATVEIRPPHWTVRAGDSVPLEGLPRDKRGRVLSGRELRWTTEDPGLVRVGQDGVVEALAHGAARIVAECAGCRGALTLVIEPPPVVSLQMPDPPAVVRPGDELELQAIPLDRGGRPIPARAARWTSSDRAVVRVGPEDELLAVGEGRATLTARCDGVEASLAVEVVSPVVRDLRIPAPPDDVRPGSFFSLEPEIFDDVGRRVESRKVRWSSSRPDILRPLGDGDFLAVHEGVVRVFCRLGDIEAVREVRVREPLADAAPAPSAGPAGGTADAQTVEADAVAVPAGVPRAPGARAGRSPSEGPRGPWHRRGVLLGIPLVGLAAALLVMGVPFLDRGPGPEPDAPPASSSALPAPPPLYPGESLDLAALARMAGHPPAALLWNVPAADRPVAVVEADDRLVARGPGSARLLAAVGSEPSVTLPIRVLDPDDAGPRLEIVLPGGVVPVGYDDVLPLDHTDAAGRALPRDDVRWMVTDVSGPGVVELTPDGRLTALAPGRVEVVAYTGEAATRALLVVRAPR